MDAVSILKNTIPDVPSIAVQLGSGFDFLANFCENKTEIPYMDLPGFPTPSVEGHRGKIVYGTIEKVPVLFLSGRAHYYEGYDLKTIAFPIKTMHKFGIRRLLLTNAAGALNTIFRPGELMMITDHINFSGINPFRGEYDEEDGPRFPDQSEVYTKTLQKSILAAAIAADVRLHQGVYIWFSGPSYETPAEVRMARILGADAVGMSTVPEAMIANRLGMQVAGISLITNMAAGLLDQPLSHDEVLQTAQISSESIERLFRIWVQEVNTNVSCD